MNTSSAAKELCADFRPGNRPDGSGLDLIPAPLSLSCPGLLDIGVRRGFEAFDQQSRERRPLAFRELECFAK